MMLTPGRCLRRSVLALAVSFVLTIQDAAPGQVPDASARQVTVFGVIATPGDHRTDPKLARVEPQLRKLLPGYGFRLLDVQSKRLSAGEAVTCTLEDGFTTTTTLVRPVDDNGKVQLRCVVRRDQAVRFEKDVSTPQDQLFFWDQALEGGVHLLVGIGAR
jgi:hypothetical protein